MNQAELLTETPAKPSSLQVHAAVVTLMAGLLYPAADQAADVQRPQTVPSKKAEAIPWSQIGAKAGADYHGDGLAVAATATGARLHCVFQRLDGEATSEGLWLESTVTKAPGDRFRVRAVAVERGAGDVEHGATEPRGVVSAIQGPSLAERGTVTVEGQTVRFSRPGLVEEYSASMDGVRQDFVVTQKPAGGGELRVELLVTGARVEKTAYGAQLVLESSGRKIAFSRLHVTDANGKELPARMEVRGGKVESRKQKAEMSQSLLTSAATEERGAATGSDPPGLGLVVVVEDAGAVYPVRIDPTFSDANWVSMNPSIPGVDGDVYAAVMDGAGNLYIGGSFSVAGSVVAHGVAKWDGSSWSALGSGMSGGDDYGPYVAALAVSGGSLYAGGDFTTAGGNASTNISQWNGSSWLPLGSGMDNWVNALAFSGGTLCAGGAFTMAGGNAANHIAQWNGSSWSPLGSGVGEYGEEVFALAVSGGALYVGGYFETAGGQEADYIAQWDGSTWWAVGSGMNRDVLALAVSGGTLYAGGRFTSAGGKTANYVAQWDGIAWLPLASGMDDWVNALAMSGGTLYAGGVFTMAGGNAANHTAQWNGSSWSPLGSGMSGNRLEGTQVHGPYISALAASVTTLFGGGVFTTSDGRAASNIAQWNGSSWSSLGVGSGMDGSIYAMALSGSTLFVGGKFTTAGGNVANNIAQWNGSSWSSLGSGVGGVGPEVFALAVSGDTLFAGGRFTTAGGIAATNIAQWDGSSWSPLGPGLVAGVTALAVSGSTLYAAGGIPTLGGREANHIAQWDGSSWSPLGLGFPGGSVYALAVSCGRLYAGGRFSTAGDSAASNIAQWDGSSWSPVGSGVNGGAGIVWALVVSGGTLFAGGQFTMAGGNEANCIAQWDGSTWSPLGLGFLPALIYGVSTLALSGTNLYAGGWFTTAGDSTGTYNFIAQWDGSSWSPLGSGMNNVVRALLVWGDSLYAGGDFTTAGGKVSAYVAKAQLIAPYGGLITSIAPAPGTAMLQGLGNPGAVFDVQRTGNLLVPVSWTTLTADPLSPAADGSLNYQDTHAPAGAAYYRLVQH